MSDVPFIRFPRRGDGPRVVELAQMALQGGGDVGLLKRLAEQCERYSDDWREVPTRRGVVPVLASMRVVDRGDGQVVGFSYCCPPIGWIVRDSGAPSFAVVKRIAAALIEIEMLAVMPRFRWRGLGGRLVADCVERYREAGYRVAMVTVERSPAKVVSWWEREGFRFTQVAEPAYVRCWPRREGSLYGHVLPSQRLGFQGLVPGVTVQEAQVDVPEYRCARWGGTASGLYAADGGLRHVRPVVEVSSLLG